MNDAGHQSPFASREEMLDVAKSQRGMMWLFAAKFALDFGASTIRGTMREGDIQPLVIVYLAVYTLVSLAVAYYVFRTARVIYDVFPAIICGLIVLSPCLGTLTILVLNGTTMDRLRKAGVKSGFFGVDKRELEKLRSRE